MNNSKDYIDVLLKGKFKKSSGFFPSFDKEKICYHREVDFGYIAFFEFATNLDFVVFDKKKNNISLIHDINIIIVIDKFYLFAQRSVEKINSFTNYAIKK